MKMKRVLGWSALLSPVFVPLRAQIPRADSLAFATVTQQLFDAVTSGDSTVWARYLSPRWAVTDEEGHRIGRSEFLATLHPLPAGQSGEIRLAEWHYVATAAVTVMSYTVDESHNFYGQHLQTRFSGTDTWVKERDGWRMLASQITALPTPIAGRALSRAQLDRFPGEYGLTPDIAVTIALSDSGLEMIGRSGRHERLYALNERAFVRHGVRGFWLFETDSAGTVSRLVNWRDNNAVVWVRRAPH